VSYFSVTVEGPAKDLHSGVFGGTVHEPMTDLVFLMNSLVKPDGEILIPGINDQVAPLDETETALYQDIAFSMTELHDAIGSTTALFPDEKNILMHRYQPPNHPKKKFHTVKLIIGGVTPLFPSTGSKVPFPPPAQKLSSPPLSKENSRLEQFPTWNHPI